MKLSALEMLVAAMRSKATDMGIADPNVEFYENDRAAILAAHATGVAFMNMEVEPDVLENSLREYVVLSDGDKAQRGDFAIPLQLC